MLYRLASPITVRSALRAAVALLLVFGPLASPALALAPVTPTGFQQTGQTEEHEEREDGPRSAEAVGHTGPPRRPAPPAQTVDPDFGLFRNQFRQSAHPFAPPPLDPFRNGLGTPYRC